MTSGKRPNLFRTTVESFCSNCLDIGLIKRWICIDDGTDAQERAALAAEFPFIEFIYKDPADVGHAKSLNILLPMMQASGEYFVRLEDDWKFIKPGFFISDAIKILEANPSLGQVMFNRNYQQTAHENLRGGVPDKVEDVAFLRHEHIVTPEEKEDWFRRHGAGPGPAVLTSWPHFSLQPSVTRVAAAAAQFREDSSYFEYQYGLDYMARGWRTAFLADVYCEHIGRKLNDFAGPANAYELLGQEHFGNKPRQGVTHYSYLPEN